MAEPRSRAGSRAGARSRVRSERERDREREDDSAPPPPPRQPVCPVGFCPVGMALTVAGTVRPEVVEHLMRAGAELLLAVKAVIDARAESMGRESPLERITIE